MQTNPHTTNPYGGGSPRCLTIEDLIIDRADAIASLAVARIEGTDAEAAYWISEIKRITDALDALR